jgi:predicted dehydrogenase
VSEEQVLDDDTVRVMDLVLPIPVMADAIAACLAAGKHVLSEKPGACSVRSAAALWRVYSQPSPLVRP